MNRHASCERVRALVALAPDGELSEVEERRLAVHLRGCRSCQAFAADTAAVATHLRHTPLEAPHRRIVVPARRRLVPGVAVAAAAAAAAAAALAIGLADLGAERPGSPALLTAATVAPELNEAERLRRDRIGARNAHFGLADRAFGAIL